MPKHGKIRISDLRRAAETATSWTQLAQDFGMTTRLLRETCTRHNIKPQFRQQQPSQRSNNV